MSSPSQLRVFISYSTPTLPWAKWAECQLRHFGYVTQMAEHADSADDAVDQRIATCDVMIALLSRSYEQSKRCAREWERAEELSKLRQVVVQSYRPSERFARHAYRTLYDKQEADAAIELKTLVEGALWPVHASVLPGGPAFPGRASHAWVLPAVAFGCAGLLGVLLIHLTQLAGAAQSSFAPENTSLSPARMSLTALAPEPLFVPLAADSQPPSAAEAETASPTQTDRHKPRPSVPAVTDQQPSAATPTEH